MSGKKGKSPEKAEEAGKKKGETPKKAEAAKETKETPKKETPKKAAEAAKPAETKPAEAKPAEAKPAEAAATPTKAAEPAKKSEKGAKKAADTPKKGEATPKAQETPEKEATGSAPAAAASGKKEKKGGKAAAAEKGKEEPAKDTPCNCKAGGECHCGDNCSCGTEKGGCSCKSGGACKCGDKCNCAKAAACGNKACKCGDKCTCTDECKCPKGKCTKNCKCGDSCACGENCTCLPSSSATPSTAGPSCPCGECKCCPSGCDGSCECAKGAACKCKDKGKDKDGECHCAGATPFKPYKQAFLAQAKGKFEIAVRTQRPTLSFGQVMIRTEACGICHSDGATLMGALGATFPRSPGHEVVGIVEQVHPSVEFPQVGDRVGLGWFGAYCQACDSCRRGQFVFCKKAPVTGLHFDGGYSGVVVANWTGCVRLPKDVDAAELAPLMCAGITVYNALVKAQAPPGSLVAVQGIGGLGHLGLQYANKMGFQVAAVTSASKADLAKKLGAHYIINSDGDIAAELNKLGGARVILMTSPSNELCSKLFAGIGPYGNMVVLGFDHSSPVCVPPHALIANSSSVSGSPSGTPYDNEVQIKFATMHGVKAMVERFPIDKVQEAFDGTMAQKPRFRNVIVFN